MIQISPALLLRAVAAWRTPAAWRDLSKRPLWIAFTALAVAMTIRAVSVASAVDAFVRVNNLSFLCKHLSGIIAAHAVLKFVHIMADEKAIRTPRLRIAIPVAAACAITVLFFAAPTFHEATDLLADDAGDWHIAAYGVVWSAYLGAALLSATRLCWRWGRQPDTGLLGRGLRLTGIGTTIGLAYAAHRMLSLTLRYFGANPLPTTTDDQISSALLYGALLLIIVGSSLPATGRARRWLRSYRDLSTLYPLWLSLTDAVPGVRFDPPRHGPAETFNFRHTNDRLYRRSIEIRDAILVLSDHAPSILRAQAEDYVKAAGLLRAAADAAAEACWLHCAREAHSRNEPPSGEQTPPAGGGGDLSDEIRELKMLAAAYGSDLAIDFATLNRSKHMETT